MFWKCMFTKLIVSLLDFIRSSSFVSTFSVFQSVQQREGEPLSFEMNQATPLHQETVSVVSVKMCCYSNPGHEINVFLKKEQKLGVGWLERWNGCRRAQCHHLRLILSQMLVFSTTQQSGMRLSGRGHSSLKTDTVDGPGNTPICYNRTAG